MVFAFCLTQTENGIPVYWTANSYSIRNCFVYLKIEILDGAVSIRHIVNIFICCCFDFRQSLNKFSLCQNFRMLVEKTHRIYVASNTVAISLIDVMRERKLSKSKSAFMWFLFEFQTCKKKMLKIALLGSKRNIDCFFCCCKFSISQSTCRWIWQKLNFTKKIHFNNINRN